MKISIKIKQIGTIGFTLSIKLFVMETWYLRDLEILAYINSYQPMFIEINAFTLSELPSLL